MASTLQLLLMLSLFLGIVLLVLLIVLVAAPKQTPPRGKRKRVVTDLAKIKEQVNGDHE